MFPQELVERILFHCDGCTLFRARAVCKLWKDSADYLIKKKDQLSVCCEREICPMTLAELSVTENDVTSLYRAWYRHSRVSRWPVTMMAPLEMTSNGALTVTCIDGNCMVATSSVEDGVCLFDLFGHLVYRLPFCANGFPVKQLEISRPHAALEERRLMVIAHHNNMVRVGGFWHEDPNATAPPVPLITREGDDISVSVCEDMICLSYPREAWLYRAKLGRRMVDVDTLCVVDLRSADALRPMARCCSRMAYVALRGGSLVWCDTRKHALAVMGSLPYPAMSLTPRTSANAGGDTASAEIQPEHLQSVHFNTVNLVASLGTEVVVGHAELGCRTLDAYTALRSRVSACLLHGRLMLLGTETGMLVMYFVPSERALLDVDLSRPSGQIHLADEALYRLYVVDQNETVRVLAQGAGGRLHHCYWRRPGAGYMPPAEDEPLKTRYLIPDGAHYRGWWPQVPRDYDD